jgi:hypothetical protein
MITERDIDASRTAQCTDGAEAADPQDERLPDSL